MYLEERQISKKVLLILEWLQVMKLYEIGMLWMLYQQNNECHCYILQTVLLLTLLLLINNIICYYYANNMLKKEGIDALTI